MKLNLLPRKHPSLDAIHLREMAGACYGEMDAPHTRTPPGGGASATATEGEARRGNRDSTTVGRSEDQAMSYGHGTRGT